MNFSKVKRQNAINEWGTLLQRNIPELADAKNSYKLGWLSEYVDNHSRMESANASLNESSSTFPTYGQTAMLSNINGMGAVQPAAAPGGPRTFYTGATGSGDNWGSTLPISIQVASRTVGFDIVNVIPMNGPKDTLSYIDYVYAGGKKNGQPDKPQMFSLDHDGKFTDSLGNISTFTIQPNETYLFTNGTKALRAIFVGYSRITGYPIFRTGLTYNYTPDTPTDLGTGATVENNKIMLAEIFDGNASIWKHIDNSGVITSIAGTTDSGAVRNRVELVKALEDHIQGFAGAGNEDEDPWVSGTNGKLPADPMSRATGEVEYYRTMNLRSFTKFIEAKTYQVAMDVTTEQLQDMDRQWGIQVMSMAESILVNEISQSINKHILSRVFALGWQNNYDINKVEKMTLNCSVNPARSTTSKVSFLGKLGFGVECDVKAFTNVGGFENMSTIQRRIQTNILAASNIIQQRGRRGPGNFIVTNLILATALQDNSNYSFSPSVNTLAQDSGALYPMGTVFGMNLYVDPNMAMDDTRIVVGRKGDDYEPGIKLMPYIMAEVIQTIVEGSMAPKIAVKTRYALVEAGHHPQTQYYTFYVDGAKDHLIA